MRTLTIKLLPCGCHRGYQLCNIAEILWRSATEAYMIAMIDPTHGENWSRWVTARAAYDDHFEMVETNQTPIPVENVFP